MDNLIIQHWDKGERGLPPWAKYCVDSIKRYADRIGCDYKLEYGFPLPQIPHDPKPVTQKLCAINEEYDSYDNVLILDIDMLATHFAENIFVHKGIGRLHRKAMEKIEGSSNGTRWPGLYEQGAPQFFGNCVKLNRETRIACRKVLPDTQFLEQHLSQIDRNRPPNDEVLLSYLLKKSNILEGVEELELPHARFCDLPDEAAINATLLHFCGQRKNRAFNYPGVIK